MQELDATDLVRQVPIRYQPHELTADWVLITHEHMDHCVRIPCQPCPGQPQAQLVGPLTVRKQLEQWGISGSGSCSHRRTSLTRG